MQTKKCFYVFSNSYPVGRLLLVSDKSEYYSFFRVSYQNISVVITKKRSVVVLDSRSGDHLATLEGTLSEGRFVECEVCLHQMSSTPIEN